MTHAAISERSALELRAQAAEYRRLAETAHTTAAVDALLRLAARFDALADLREQKSASSTVSVG